MTSAAPRTPPTIRPEMTAALMAQTGLDLDQITEVVHRFYDRIRRDALLGPIFEERVDDWPAHLAKLVDFWCSVALMTGTFKGAPMPAHVTLPVGWAHFEHWLTLFHETTATVCTPAGAAHLDERARRIARSLHMAIEDFGAAGNFATTAAVPRL